MKDRGSSSSSSSRDLERFRELIEAHRVQGNVERRLRANFVNSKLHSEFVERLNEFNHVFKYEILKKVCEKREDLILELTEACDSEKMDVDSNFKLTFDDSRTYNLKNENDFELVKMIRWVTRLNDQSNYDDWCRIVNEIMK